MLVELRTDGVQCAAFKQMNLIFIIRLKKKYNISVIMEKIYKCESLHPPPPPHFLNNPPFSQISLFIQHLIIGRKVNTYFIYFC